MQQENELNFADQILPKRQTATTIQLKADPEKFLTNYYNIKLNQKARQLWQYSLDSSEAPTDNTELIDRLVFQKKSALIEKIGLVVSKGNMLWGTIENKSAISLQVEDKANQASKKYHLIVKLVKRIAIRDLLILPQSKHQALQIMNINVKRRLKNMGMKQLSKGTYFNKKQFDQKALDRVPLRIWKGYKISLSLIWDTPYIQIDRCFRILRQNNFLEDINSLESLDEAMSFIGSSVLANYGNRKTYKIKGILRDKCPRDKFQKLDQKGSTSFIQYYQVHYNIKIMDYKQPLILAENPLAHSKKFHGKCSDIYLIPELVSLCGIPEQILKDRKQIQLISDVIKITPMARLSCYDQIIKEINNQPDKMFDITHIKTVNGYILPDPNIEAFQKSILKSSDGQIRLKQPILNPKSFNDWYFIYSDNGQFGKQEADSAIYDLIEASKTFDITIKFQNVIKIGIKKQKNGQRLNAQEWKKQIRQVLSQRQDKNKPPQLLLFFFNHFETQYYAEMKKFSILQINCPSQCVKKSTLLKTNKLSKASKIVLQMNAKIGGPLWKINSNSPYMKEKKVMYGGISNSKGKNGLSLSLVGTRDLDMKHFFSDAKHSKVWNKRQDIDQKVYDDIFMNWGRSFFRQNNRTILPDGIIIYREGLSDEQIKKQVPLELQSLQKMVNKFSEMGKRANYAPDVVYLVVNKKIQTRIFEELKNRETRGKFAPKYFNPVPGSVITSQLSKNNSYDFHLIPQHAGMGTCTPTLYKIAYQSPNCRIKEDDIINFTFQQCFNYFNWAGAVRVPGCLQNANKLSKLISEYIQNDGPKHEQLQKYLYFL